LGNVRSLLGIVVTAVWFSGCVAEGVESDCQHPQGVAGAEGRAASGLAVAELALSSFDCAERNDNGYTSGTPTPITVVTVDSKPVETQTANAYYVMAQAAEREGIQLRVVSGFRTYAQQQYLYNCYRNCNCNGCNLAARPGYSNHQSGHALDLNTGGWNTAAYNWLTANGAAYGFRRTVASEHWHWEWWGGGPGGGICGPQEPNITVEVRTHPPTGQPSDVRPEGSSNGVMDLYRGNEFVTEIIVRNTPGAAQTQTGDSVIVWAWFETPYIKPLSYNIYTDWPAFDLATWQISNADARPENPPHDDPAVAAAYSMGHFAGGEGKRIRFVTRADRYSVGKVDHPDVRVWVQHVAGWYGEQTSWNDPVEVNGAGSGVFLRHFKQHDVYSRSRWDFDGPQAAETEGWGTPHGVGRLSVGGGVLTVPITGADPHLQVTTARIDAMSHKAVRVRAQVTGDARRSQLFYVTDTDGAWNQAKSATFITPAGDTMHTLHVDFSDDPAWSGVVTGLRLDPAVSGLGTYTVNQILSVASGTTSGDADADGYLASPGPDCDDTRAAIHPGATEVCNGLDDNCDDATDEGVTNPCGGCGAVPEEVCNSADDDCDGDTDEGCVPCDAATEVCNGLDDDCDGETDEGVTNACGACGVVAGEDCNGLDDDCDGDTDEECDGCKPSEEVCNGVDDDCDGQSDEGEVCALCLPGATGPCSRDDLADACQAGQRTCDLTGAWGNCEPPAGCDAPDVADEDTTGGDIAGDIGADTGTYVSSVDYVEHRRDNGCSAGSEQAPPYVWLVILLAALASWRRSSRLGAKKR
jgi:MYXO-CTERM domain-containing protein